MLGTQTRGHMIVGADDTMELWRPPILCSCWLIFLKGRTESRADVKQILAERIYTMLKFSTIVG